MGSRFRELRELGRGGMGAVYLVEDRRWDLIVAQKRILVDNPEYLLRFKREFREIEGLSHPNLVALFELDEDERGIFFTMEKLDGVELSKFCLDSSYAVPNAPTVEHHPVDQQSSEVLALAETGVPDTDDFSRAVTLDTDATIQSLNSGAARVEEDVLAKILYATPQIVDALAYLHGEGIVHRDLKPSNVMMTSDGTVKLLDFGIVGRVGNDSPLDRPNSPIGTVGFMAPEQIRGKDPLPATDVYALGAILFELLTRRPVFVGGSTLAVFMKHLDEESPRVSSLVEGVPPELDDAIHAMLAKRPEDRPKLEDLRAVLGSSTAGHVSRSNQVIGRQSLKARLGMLVRDADGPSVVLLTGPSGVGKTTLLDWMADEVPGTSFRGRGRERDRTAFNALDPIVDELSLYLRREPLPDVTDVSGRAAKLFGVLGDPVPGTTRESAFTALAQLLSDIPGEVFLCVDDLQWADVDSLALLEFLVMRSEGTRVIATLRDDLDTTAVDDVFEALPGTLSVRVEGLDRESVRSIIESHAGKTASAEVVESCKGSPFLAEVVGRASRLGREVVDAGVGLSVLLESLDERQTEILRLVDACARWVSPRDLADLTDRRLGEVEQDLILLEARGLIHAARHDEARVVDLYHDVVRQGLRATTTDDIRRHSHLKLARYLSERDDPPVHEVARHFAESGRGDEAAIWARKAAVDAEAKLAWSLAADMWALTGDAGEDVSSRRAEALDRAGRYVEAARAWEKVAKQSEGRDRRMAALKQGIALLAANQIEEGYEIVETMLRGERGWGTKLTEGLAAARFMAGPSLRQSRNLATLGAPGDPQFEERAEEELRLAMILAFFDSLRGLSVIMRVREELVDHGCRERVAWCDYLLSYISHHRSCSGDEPRLARRYFDSAEILMEGHERSSPQLEAFPVLIRATRSFRRGDLRSAIEESDRGLALLEKSGVAGTFEYMYLLASKTRWTMLSQDLDAFASMVEIFERSSGRSEHFAMLAHLKFSQIFLAAFQGRFEESRQHSADLDRRLSRPTIHRVLNRGFMHLADVWTTDCHEALPAVREMVDEGARFGISKTLFASFQLGFAALVEANAVRTGHPRAERERVFELAAHCDESVPTVPAWALRARAYVLDEAGDEARCIEELEEALARARSRGQGIDAAISRYQLGLRIAGPEGARLREQARTEIVAIGSSEALLFEDAGRRQ